jgi:tetratricopeptide (TPR) repeat protein
MSILSAENQFKKGLAALIAERNVEAAELFKSALDMERERSVRRPAARYLSYYGLSLAKLHGASTDALRACETAARLEPQNPSILLNLGRLYAMAGRRAKALDCFARGLQMAPRNGALSRELARVERRNRPVLPRLRRSHLANRWLGAMRARVLAPGKSQWSSRWPWRLIRQPMVSLLSSTL